MELVVASSTVDAGISCWDLHSGAEQLRYRGCTSPPHGLTCVGRRFLASSQLRDAPSSSGSILYWSWKKAQPEVKSFPAEPINPVASTSYGTYLAGGGASGDIYLWEVPSGRLLKRWHAHYRSVTCMVFADGDSLLISGGEDGSVRVWNLIRLFDKVGDTMSSHPYEHSFTEHTLKVTDVALGYGGCSAIVVSSSEDRTCKVWRLSTGTLLRTVVFPSIVNAVAVDPGESVFYAGCNDGNIYIAALNAVGDSGSSYGLHIIGSLSDHSKAVTCLAFSSDGISLVSSSEDGSVRVWDTRSNSVVRIFKYAKGPVNNVIVVCLPIPSDPPMLEHTPPPLDKYVDSDDGNVDARPIKAILFPCNESFEAQYLSSSATLNHIKEMQSGSSAAMEMELERSRQNCRKALQMAEKWKKMYHRLLQSKVDDILDGAESGED